MAGTCGLHVQRGDALTVVCATGGLRTHNERLGEELRKPRDQQDPKGVGEPARAYGERKHRELVKACALFGITDVRVLPFPHHYLRPSRELDQAIADIILELRPHLLLTHATYAPAIKGHSDTRPSDHLTTGLAGADLRQWLSGKLEAVRQDCGASGEPMPARLDF